MIRDLLDPPDKTKPNHRGRLNDIKLYDADRVAAVEVTVAFRGAQAKAEVRRGAANTRVAARRYELLVYVRNLKIDVPRVSKRELIRRACAWFNDSERVQAGADPARIDADKELLDRICVNYVRHALTQYDAACEVLRGKAGCDDAHLELKERVLDAIADHYLWLEVECFRQCCAAEQAALSMEFE